MIAADVLAEVHRRGTPRWAEQAIKADAVRGVIEYLINNYNMHVDAARQGLGGDVRMPRLRLEEEQ